MNRPADDLERELSDTSWLRRLARSLVRDDATADDVVQETCVAAVRAGPERPRSLRAWLASVARNAARRTHRDARRRTEREAVVARPEASSDAAETADRLEASRALLAALESLEEPYRTAMRLRWMDGLAPRDVAARTGVSPEVAWQRLSRGLAMLRARLDRDRGGRRAWLFLVADLGGVRQEELPLLPLAAGAAAAALSWQVAAAVVLVTACGLAVVAAVAVSSVGAATGGSGAPEEPVARTQVDRASGTTPAGAGRRAPRLRARADVGGAGTSDADETPFSESERAEVAADRAAPEQQPDDRIVGRVLDPDGRPVANATVSRRVNGTRAGVVACTGADGTFVLAQPADGSIGTRLMVESDDWATTFVNAPALAAGEVSAGDIVVAAREPIAGLVSTPDGTPLGGGRVLLTRASEGQAEGPVTVGKDGRFRFEGAGPGSWSAHLSPPAGEERRWVCVNSFQEVVAGDTDVRFVVTLREPGKARVRLEVVDAAGTPVDIGSGMMRVPVLSSATALSAASFDEGRDTGVGLAMTGRSVTLRSGDAAGDGSKPAGSLPQSWLENIRPGDWWLVLKAPDLGPALVPLHVDAADRELRARIVLPKPGSLRVGVDFGDAAPPPETMVIVGGLPGAPWRSRIWLDDLHVGGYARRSDDGLWALDGIMPGRYTITLYAGHLCSEVLTVDVPSGGVARASLTARPGGVVEWTPVVPRNHEAEFAFAVGDGEFEVVTEQVGFGRPLGIPLPSFPPGRLRWRVRVAQQGVLASEGRRIATYSGEVTVVAGRNVTLPEGPFEPAR